MGLASCVRPGAHRGPPATATQGYTIEVVTRTQVVVLVSWRIFINLEIKIKEYMEYFSDTHRL
jgi:hypothetical protein